MIITGAYVGYHAWEASLPEQPEKHSEEIEIEKNQPQFLSILFQTKADLVAMNR